MRTIRLLAVLACVTVLAACGGGGGSSSGGSSGGSSNRGAFTLSANTASFAVAKQGTNAPNQSFVITLTGTDIATVGAAYSASQTPAPWLNVAINGSGRTLSLDLSVSNFEDAGDYTTAFTVGTADASGKVLKQQVFTVQLKVYAKIAINSPPPASSYIFGDLNRTYVIPIVVQGPARNWSITGDAAWLKAPATKFTGTQTVNVGVDITGLAPGSYYSWVFARDDGDFVNVVGTQVSITITPPIFSVTQTQVTFGGKYGDEPLVSMPLDFSLSTVAGQPAFTVTATTDSDGSWLQVANPTGTVGSVGANVSLNVAPGQLRGATRTGQVKVSVTMGTSLFEQTIPVTWNREANRLVVSANGVGLSRTPFRDVLTRTIKVYSAARRDGTPWTAQSDQPWLVVTPSGTTDGNLTLTATPTGLATNTTHFANVTVQSSDPTVENSQTVRVGLYVTPNAPISTAFAEIASHIATSPVEPIVALSGGSSGNVRIYNVYNGVLLRTLTDVAATPASLKFSGDGTRLYISDTTNLNVRAVNPDTGAQLATFDATSISTDRGRAIEIMRPNGHEILITPGGKVYDTTSGALYANAPYNSAMQALSFAHSPDQRLVVPHFGLVSRLARTALRGGGLEIEILNLLVLSTDWGELCFNEASDRIYSAYGGGNPHSLTATSLATGQVVQQLPMPTYPSTIRCAWNGLIVGGSQGQYPGDADVYTFNGTTGINRGNLLSSSGVIYGEYLLRRGFDVSADGSRLISLYGGYVENLSRGVSMQTLPTPQ